MSRRASSDEQSARGEKAITGHEPAPAGAVGLDRTVAAVVARVEGWIATESRLLIVVGVLLGLSVARTAVTEQHHDTHIHVHQAVAFLNGSLSLAQPITDAAIVGDRYYCVFPPFPTVLLMPFVALFGTGFKTLLLTPFLGVLATLFAHRLALNLDVDGVLARWAALGLGLGTALWQCVRFPQATFLAHCCAVLLAMIALNECFGRRRGWLVGLTLGCAILSRQLLILTVPFALAVLWQRSQHETSAIRWRRLLSAIALISVCGASYLLLNWARFGSALDPGYTYLGEADWYGYRTERWGNFNWIYVPSNILRLFLLGFGLEFEPPSYLLPVMRVEGTALTFASPFLFYALLGRLRQRWLNALGGSTIAAICLAVLAHKSSMGGWQVNGLRYTLDFVPLLFVFLVLAMQRLRGSGHATVVKLMICYAVLLNAFALGAMPLLRRLLLQLPH